MAMSVFDELPRAQEDTLLTSGSAQRCSRRWRWYWTRNSQTQTRSCMRVNIGKDDGMIRGRTEDAW